MGDAIEEKTFNVTGTDDLIWGGNSKDYHVGYHGRGNRARFIVRWTTGEGWYWTDDDDEDEDHEPDDDENLDDEDSGAAANCFLYESTTTRWGSFLISIL